MDEFSMKTAIYLGSDYALTAHPMAHLTSQTTILSVNFVFNLDFAFKYYCNRQVDIKFAGRLSSSVGVYIFRMARTSLAHTPMYYDISQFGQ
jgi:hypothetical protein